MEKRYSAKADASVMAIFNANMLDTNVWKSDPKGTYSLATATVKTVKAADAETDSLVALTMNTVAAADNSKHVCTDSCMSSGTCPMHQPNLVAVMSKISVFHLKVIKSNNKYFDRALLLNDTTLITHDSVDVVTNVKGVKTATKQERLQTWNLKPENHFLFIMILKS